MKTVLLVEDDEAFAYAAKKMVEEAGYSVRLVPTTMEGLHVIEAGTAIDIVVTDIRMPPGQPHGFSFGTMVHRRRPKMPIVYMTAYRDLGEFADDADRILFKPLEDGALIKEINARLTGSNGG
jgi:CheY-like chemotaxis protein